MGVSPKSPVMHEQDPLPDLSGIDVKNGLARVGGNSKVYTSLLIKFHNRYADKIDEIKNLVHDQRREEARREAHKLKGLSGNIGATELYNALADLEAALTEEIDEETTELLHTCGMAMDKTLEIISPLAADVSRPFKAAKTEGVPKDIRKFKPLFVKLFNLLRDDDTEACLVADELAENITGVEGNELQKVREYISKYDFEKALEYLEQVKKKYGLSFDEDTL